MSKQIKSSYTSVFDRESKDQVKSPDKLNEYIRVSTPAVWLLAAALAVVLAALIIWGTTGSVPVNTKTTGVGMRMDFNADEVNLKSEDEAYLRKTYEVKNLFCLVDSSVGMVKNLDNKEASVVFRDGRRVKGTAHIIGSYMLEDDEIHKLLDFTDAPLDVSDPWFTGKFEQTFDDLTRGCEAFLLHLERNGAL